MSQHDLDLANAAGASFRADLNNALAALGSCMKGPSAPSPPLAGMLWLDDDTPSATVWALKMYDGADWIELCLLDTTNNQWFWSFNTLTALTAPAVGDFLAIYDLSATTYRKITLANFFAIIDGLTAETAPAEDDELAIFDASAAAARKMTRANWLSGTVVQRQDASSSAVDTTTTNIPIDDTIPQITEGKEALTVSITPKSASNILLIEATALLSAGNSGTSASIALFQDATANALAAAADYWGQAQRLQPIQLKYRMAAGTTSATTFRLRFGPDAGDTLTLNGNSGSRRFGAIAKTTLTVTEYRP